MKLTHMQIEAAIDQQRQFFVAALMTYRYDKAAQHAAILAELRHMLTQGMGGGDPGSGFDG